MRYTHIVSLLLGILGAPFSGLLTIGWIRLLGRIALVVDDRGVMDSTSMLSVGFICSLYRSTYCSSCFAIFS